MSKQELTGRELKQQLRRLNYERLVNDDEEIRQQDIAEALGVTQGAISRVLTEDPKFIVPDLRRRIAEYLDSLEQGKKPLPNRMYKKTLITR